MGGTFIILLAYHDSMDFTDFDAIRIGILPKSFTYADLADNLSGFCSPRGSHFFPICWQFVGKTVVLEFPSSCESHFIKSSAEAPFIIEHLNVIGGRHLHIDLQRSHCSTAVGTDCSPVTATRTYYPLVVGRHRRSS